jgi:hypothetical protein
MTGNLVIKVIAGTLTYIVLWITPCREHRSAGQHPPAQHRNQERLQTTEFIAYVVMFAGILLTIGYLVARGLAKSGSREPYDDSSQH